MASLPIIEKTYSLYAQLADISYHAEKRWRYTLAAQAERNLLAMLQELVMAAQAPKPLKAGHLLRVSGQSEALRFALRLMLERGVVNETKIFQAQSQLTEIGRMLGGWLKSLGA